VGCPTISTRRSRSTIDAYRTISTFALIPGAGSTFRRHVVNTLLSSGFYFLNETFRGAKMAVTGEDRELSVLFNCFGWKMGVDTRMTLLHAIDEKRLTPAYLIRLCQSIGAGNEATDLLEAQRDGRLDDWKLNWWWRAAQHFKALARLSPDAISRALRGGDIDMQLGRWNMQVGALRRCLKERGGLLKKVRLRAQAPWASLTDVSAPGTRSPRAS
jgi:hypothetical protein